MKILRLTENDLKHIIAESARRIIREYTGDDEEYGRYDLNQEDDEVYPFGNDDEVSDYAGPKIPEGLSPEDRELIEIEWSNQESEPTVYLGDGDLYRYGM